MCSRWIDDFTTKDKNNIFRKQLRLFHKRKYFKYNYKGIVFSICIKFINSVNQQSTLKE